MPTTSNGPPVSAISCSSRSSKLTKHITHELRWADPAAYPPRTSCWLPSCTAVDDFVIARDWREYRTHFHIAQTYQVSEATVRRITRQVEDAVIQHPLLHLSGKKRLLLASPGKAVSTTCLTGQSRVHRSCRCDRMPGGTPQKNSTISTAGRRSGTRKKPS